MSDEGFLRRWSRLKADPAAAQPVAASAPAAPRPEAARAPTIEPPAPRAAQPGGAAAPALPTLDDVARLNADSDFSAFVSKGVDKDVRRLAMKKLFSDPHFKLIDRLDVYMDDYNKPSPMSETMLAALHHTKNLFAPLASDATKADTDAAEAVDGVAMTEREAGTADDPGGAAKPDGTPAGAATTEDAADAAALAGAATLTRAAAAGAEPLPAAAPVELEPMQYHGAAAGGVLQQTLQGKA